MALCSLTMKLPLSPCSSLIKKSITTPRRTMSPAFLNRRMCSTVASASATPENNDNSSVAVQVNQNPDTKDNNTMQRRPSRRPPLDMISPFGLVDSLSPMRTMRQMLETMDRMFDDAMSFPTIGNGEIRAPWEMREDGENVRMRFDLPGLSKEEVQVKVEDDVLVVKGKRMEKGDGGDDGWWKGEKESSYEMQVMLPDGCEAEKVKAEMKEGVLVVTVPKTKKEKNVIDVQIQ